MLSLTPIPKLQEWGEQDEWDGEESVVLLCNLHPSTANMWCLADVNLEYVARPTTATWFW